MFVIQVIRCLIVLGSFDLIAFQPASLAVYAFNIDEEYPIVISNKFDGENAHFGATVMLLKRDVSSTNQQSGNTNDITGWIVIGAPKANSTSSEHSGIFEPGVIWRCSLGHKSRNQPEKNEICQTVVMDPTGEYDPLDSRLPVKDRKDGGWLGGSMSVGNSERFVACGSRWKNQKFNNGLNHLLNGICYWIPKSELTATHTDPPWPILPIKYSYRLSPLLEKTYQTIRIANATNSSTDKTVIHYWSYGQFGFSSHLTANNELIVGAVGVLDWTGSVVYYRDRSGPRKQFKRHNNAYPVSPAFSEVLVASTRNLSHLQYSDYFGYSVTSGKFFEASVSKNKTQFAAGAPRSSYLSGKVLVFSMKEMNVGHSLGKLDVLVEPIEGSHTTKGNHYGSYFGASLLALDINGDGFDDLLVGAPLYGTSLRFKRNAFVPVATAEDILTVNSTAHNNSSGEDGTPKPTKTRTGDEGCVFVYVSNGEDFIRDPQELCGDKISGARFGTVVTSLQDINSDGFNDVAVGAPFENEGRGAVYIYHGGEDFLSLAQKLMPEMVDSKMRTFGWSLSLGTDIDANGYPDLAVGAYESNQVVIYRTIPIIKFNATLRASIPKLLSTTDEFNLTTCIEYSGKGTPNTLAIWVKLTVEQEQPEGKRMIALVHSDSTISEPVLQNSANHEVPSLMRAFFVSKRKLHFLKEGTCYNITVVRILAVDGIPRVAPIRMEYWIDGYENQMGSVKPIHYEIRRSETNTPTVNLSSSEADFKEFATTKLPMPADNMFGITMLKFPVGTICESDGDPKCLANLTINAWLTDPYETSRKFHNRQEFLLGSADTLTLEVELSNHREVANLPITVLVQWTRPPVMRRLPSICEVFVNTTFTAANKDQYLCSIRRPINKSQRELVAIELDMSNVYGSWKDSNLNIYLAADTNSSVVQNAVYNLSIPLRTQMRVQSFSHTASKIEYSSNASAPTFGITQAFEIGMDGPTTAAAVEIDFDIPVNISLQGKMYELIGVRRPIIDDGQIQCYPKNGPFIEEQLPMLLDPIKTSGSGINEGLGLVHDKIRRNSRSIFSKFARSDNTLLSSREYDSTDGDQDREILRIHCNLKEVTCLRVTCKAAHFTPDKKAVVEFKLRFFKNVANLLLNPDNQLEDITSLWIESVGIVRTLDSEGTPFGETGQLYFKSQLEIPLPYELPAWILIVSVAGGLFLLAIITIILMKCGFFRRTKRDELERLKRRKEIEKLYRKETKRKQQDAGTSSRTSTSSTARIRTSSSSRSKSNRKLSFSTMDPCSSILPLSCKSPATIAKQRQIPGAVDLHELRRMYDWVDQNERF